MLSRDPALRLDHVPEGRRLAKVQHVDRDALDQLLRQVERPLHEQTVPTPIEAATARRRTCSPRGISSDAVLLRLFQRVDGAQRHRDGLRKQSALVPHRKGWTHAAADPSTGPTKVISSVRTVLPVSSDRRAAVLLPVSALPVKMTARPSDLTDAE